MMLRGRGKQSWGNRSLLPRVVAIIACLSVDFAAGQDDDGGFSVRDTNVGYIDSAIPADRLRLRYDTSYDIDQGSRAEFIYARSGPIGPGFPQPERRLDLQEFSLIAERQLSARAAATVEMPFRWVNPEFNDNSAGLADINAALKYVLDENGCGRVIAGQLRAYVPTGDADRGLGVDHASLEPAMLLYQSLTDDWVFEAELRDWIALGGTDLAGNVLRYGMGLSRPQSIGCGCGFVAPVVEFVGWTVLEGDAVLVPDRNLAFVFDAEGDTIVNGKFGVRLGQRSGWDGYLGYGRVLTGDAWYHDTLRLELRWNY